MTGLIAEFILEMTSHSPVLAVCRESMIRAGEMLLLGFQSGHKLLVCGNGGSAADAEHIVGELVKGFRLRRPIPEELRLNLATIGGSDNNRAFAHLQMGLPAIALTSPATVLTAVANDQDAELIFAQQVMALGREGDLLLAVSTSGQARNVIAAAVLARAVGMKCIGLTGEAGGKLGELCDIAIRVPADDTPEVQALHIQVYHVLCSALEKALFTS